MEHYVRLDHNDYHVGIAYCDADCLERRGPKMSNTYKEDLVELVAQQISNDLQNKDTTAIHEMFADVHTGILEAYLPEDTLSALIHNELEMDDGA